MLGHKSQDRSRPETDLEKNLKRDVRIVLDKPDNRKLPNAFNYVTQILFDIISCENLKHLLPDQVNDRLSCHVAIFLLLIILWPVQLIAHV